LGIRNGDVDMYFGVEHGYCCRVGVMEVIKFVATGCHGDTMGFGLPGANVVD
jgi:hypothetical protein